MPQHIHKRRDPVKLFIENISCNNNMSLSTNPIAVAKRTLYATDPDYHEKQRAYMNNYMKYRYKSDAEFRQRCLEASKVKERNLPLEKREKRRVQSYINALNKGHIAHPKEETLIKHGVVFDTDKKIYRVA